MYMYLDWNMYIYAYVCMCVYKCVVCVCTHIHTHTYTYTSVWCVCVCMCSSQVAQWVKNCPAMQETQETWVPSLGGKDPLGKEMATHSSILAWRIPWTEEPGGLQSLGSQRVGHNRRNLSCTRAHTHIQTPRHAYSIVCSKPLIWLWVHFHFMWGFQTRYWKTFPTDSQIVKYFQVFMPSNLCHNHSTWTS